MRPNKMKQIWREGRCVTMGWLSISNGFTAEVMARQGFDALVVDMQHGLTDMASEAEIVGVLSSRPTSTQACKGLVDLALIGGGRDNVTVVLFRVAAS